MLLQILKVLLTAIIIVLISWISKKHSLVAALFASLPLTSILAFVWIYAETGDTEKISKMSSDIIWLVIPSILFFIMLPVFLKKFSMRFPAAMGLSILISAMAYAVFFQLLKFSK